MTSNMRLAKHAEKLQQEIDRLEAVIEELEGSKEFYESHGDKAPDAI